MKKIVLALFMFATVSRMPAQTQTFHDFTEITILGDTLSMATYAGKKVMVVNTASYCSYTPQFAALQALDSTYSTNNFEVIGFPCNDFGAQDPHDDSTINAFCIDLYGVTFQMMSKISITAPDTVDLYKWLQLQSLNGVADAPVTWNFNKFCIDEAGHWIMHFPQQTDPFDTAIVNWILSPNTTAIHETLSEPEVKIRSNPVRDNFTVLISNSNPLSATVFLYSAEGMLVDKVFAGKISSRKEIFYDVNKLSSGIYFVKVFLGEKEKVMKICVVK